MVGSELGIGLMKLGIGLRISNARRTVLARESRLVSKYAVNNGHAILHLAVLVHRAICQSIDFRIVSIFLHYCPSPPICDCKCMHIHRCQVTTDDPDLSKSISFTARSRLDGDNRI